MSTVAEQLKFAGEAVIRQVEITSSNGKKVDITNQVAQINVYEDIFSPFISLSIVIRESQDFLTCLPLMGEETLMLEVATPGYVKREQIIKGKFYIYKLSDREELNKKSTVYVVHAVSIESLYDLNTRNAKAYRGKPSDIAKELLGKEGLNTDKGVFIEDTVNAVKYVSNFWTPVKNLNYLCSLARNKNESPSYLFYENRYGFNFLSLEALFISDTYQRFVKDDYSAKTSQMGKVQKDLNEDYMRILNFNVKTSYDSLKNIPNGTYASRMHTFDMVKKKYTITDYHALQNFEKQKHLNKAASFSEYRPTSVLSSLFNQFKHYSAHEGFNDSSITPGLQERTSLINLLTSNNVEITILGRTDYTIGQKVHLTIPKSGPVGSKDSSDDVDSDHTGHYIITAINHSITRERHEATLELSRESNTTG